MEDSNLYIQETHVNSTDNYFIAEIPWQATPYDSRRSLFEGLRKEYGKPSKMFVDTNEGVKQVGWVFSKTKQYDDCPKQYVHEVWVTVSKTNPCRLMIASPWEKK